MVAWSAAFLHDPTFVTSASTDGTVWIWRSDPGDCMPNIYLEATSSHLQAGPIVRVEA